MNGKYSDWFKVDLHIHTDLSNKTKSNDYDGNFDIGILKAKLIENDVKLFSLTDHNIINTDAYENYYSKYTQGDPVLLVGCELDIEVKQDDDTFLIYHTLLIFNENTTEKAKEISKRIEDYFTSKQIDFESRKITLDIIFELFNAYHFFYIPHAGGHKSIIDAHKGTNIKKAQEMVLLMECAHEKVKEKHKQKHREGFDKLKDPDFKNRKDEAFINFSDNHDCKNYPVTKSGANHSFYCLKGEPTFETLRFAFIDPQSRIKNQQSVDSLKNVKKYISTLKIKGVESVDDCIIDFSPNMNVIIGGASSGKSMLFNLLGKKIENNKQSFEKYQKVDSSVLIKASNSNTLQPSLPFNSDEVLYIRQGDIIRYFEEGDLKELLIDAGKELELSRSEERIRTKKNALLTELETFKNRFDRFSTAYRKDFIIHEREFDSMLSDKFHFMDIVTSNKIIDFDLKNELLDEIISKTKDVASDEIYDFSEEEIGKIEQFEKIIIQKRQSLLKKKSIQDSVVDFINKVKNIIHEKNSNLASSSRAKSEAFKKRNELTSSCMTLFKEASEFNKSCELLENYDYKETEGVDVNNSVTLVLEIKNDISVKDKVIGCINNGDDKSSVYENYLILIRNNKKLKDYLEYSDKRLLNKLKKELENVLAKFDSPDKYLDYGKNENSKNKSPGFNAEMYLKTILQQDNCKLVMIDQPEDNLGNTFKNEELIDLFRKHKFDKQFILVTHNPSIVVYGDAESIILAVNDKGKITYEQMVLERREFQKLIIDNLDGGKAIFDMRSRKYNIKKLLNS